MEPATCSRPLLVCPCRPSAVTSSRLSLRPSRKEKLSSSWLTSTPLPMRSIRSRREHSGARSRSIHVLAASNQLLPSLGNGRLLKQTAVSKIPANERNAVMTAVESLGERVTLGDVSAKAGLKLSATERALQALVEDAQGTLEVSDEGDVLYKLPPNFRAIIAAKSLFVRLEPAVQAVQGAMSYLVRVSFGTTLLVSLAVVYASIFVLLSSKDSDSDERGSRGNGGYYRRQSSGINFYINPFDLFWYWDPWYYSPRRVRTRMEKGTGMNFVEAIFSFVLGDGDANFDLEERRWREIGALIVHSGGVVTAEQLAPFLDPPSVNAENIKTPAIQPGDETFVLPVLQRFDGHTEVDPQGNLVYRFPALQRTAQERSMLLGGRTRSHDVIPEQPFLEERPQQFSRATPEQKALAIGLGVVNLAGVIILSGMLGDPMTVRQISSGIVSLTASILPFLRVYAVSFFAIPLARWFWNKRANEEIDKRNNERRRWAVGLLRAGSALQQKLLNAQAAAKREYVGTDRIIYSTEKDVSDQQLEVAEWERKMRERM
eukprot:jgi/Chlat1/6494/Chrsp45S06065